MRPTIEVSYSYPYLVYQYLIKCSYKILLNPYSAHVHDVDINISKKSIKAIGEITMCLPEASEYCISVLLTFLSWDIEYITSQTLVVIRGKWIS